MPEGAGTSDEHKRGECVREFILKRVDYKGAEVPKQKLFKEKWVEEASRGYDMKAAFESRDREVVKDRKKDSRKRKKYAGNVDIQVDSNDFADGDDSPM